MQRDLAYLADMLDSARLVVQYVEGIKWKQFAVDVGLQDSVIRRLEVIGEAARRVSEEGRRRWPALPWADIIGMRNVVVHQYDAVDLTIVWRAAHKDVQALIGQLEAIIGADGWTPLSAIGPGPSGIGRAD